MRKSTVRNLHPTKTQISLCIHAVWSELWLSSSEENLHLLLSKMCLYENTPIQICRKFHLRKLKKFQIKNSDIFHISAQNIDCGYSLELPHWGSSNEYPQSMFLSRNKKNNVYPCKPQLKLYRRVFVMITKTYLYNFVILTPFNSTFI